MSEMKKLSENELEEVVGGVILTIKNDSLKFADVREKPGLKNPVIATLENGTKVRTTGLKIKKDGRTWYEVTLLSGSDNAWIPGDMLD